MGKNTATINYGIGSMFGNTFNMYVFGSGILTGLTFVWNLMLSQNMSDALSAALNYYIAKLTPFPLNEFLTSGGFVDVSINIAFAVAVGIVFASYRYRKNRY